MHCRGPGPHDWHSVEGAVGVDGFGSGAVVDLAQAMYADRAYSRPVSRSTIQHPRQCSYAGGDVAFALADALLEAGHPELAAHLRGEAWHPKGCWVVDLLTDRT